MKNFKKLIALDVSYNKITALPDFSKMKQFSFCNVSYNYLNSQETSTVQNVNHDIEITEPVIGDFVSKNTRRIAGHTYIPGTKVRLLVNGNVNDDEHKIPIWYAQTDENGNFVFENLDFTNLGDRKNYYIAFDFADSVYSSDCNLDPGLRWIKIK